MIRWIMKNLTGHVGHKDIVEMSVSLSYWSAIGDKLERAQIYHLFI